MTLFTLLFVVCTDENVVVPAFGFGVTGADVNGTVVGGDGVGGIGVGGFGVGGIGVVRSVQHVTESGKKKH